MFFLLFGNNTVERENRKESVTMDKQDKRPSVSVIVPAYNVENLVDRCLKSIRRQSLRNIEILVVDDGSTDRTARIVEQHAAEDSRVILCPHEKNKGLFAARITGFKASRGDYIAFVDADDEISIDWLRLLWEEAVAHNNDITAGQFFNKYDDGRMEYFNLDPLRQEMHLEGEEVFARFMEQEGSFFSWQRLWNKLYSRSLWMRALPKLEGFVEEHPRLVVGKDLTFSFALWSEASRMSTVTSGAVYYCSKDEGRSGKKTSVRDKLTALNRVLDFAETLIAERGDSEDCLMHLRRWRQHRAGFYYERLIHEGESIAKSHRTVRELLSLPEDSHPEKKTPEQDYFYSIVSPVDTELFGKMERAKERICSDDISTVSFDVFDTLVVRPFAQPTDLFMLLNDDFAKLCELNSYVNFSDLRVLAEGAARERMKKENEDFEDVTLDEIYEQLAISYAIAPDVLDVMKAKEKELEIRFCVARKMGKQFFELAKSQGKQVIICSDMYLPRETVEAILSKNGYQYDRFYLSCELRLGKWTGHLFSHVQKELGQPKSSFLHIGDNLESDVKRAKEAGWNSLQLTKTMDVLKNLNPEVYGGEAYQKLCAFEGTIRDGFNAETLFLGYRCALGLVANRLYDDPFATVAKNTDFDADAYRIGYFAVGQYLYAVTDWIIQNIKSKNAERIHFVARDGYLPMDAYREFKKHDSTLPEDNYLYVSRKALALADVYNKLDLQSFATKFPMANYSPKKFDRMMQPYYKVSAPSLQKQLGLTDEAFSAHFKTREEYDRTLLALGELVDFEKLEAHRAELRAHFQTILEKNDILFDIGYSGRAEAVLSPLLGYPVNSLYVHSNSQMVDDRERLFGFETKCFYDYKPAMTGVIREHVFMKQAPSTIGYEKVDGKLQPLFEKERFNAAERIMTRILQGAALDFVRDMCGFFEGYLDRLPYRKEDMSFLFEHYLHYSKYTDRKIFASVVFEDEMGYGKAFSALDFWDHHAAIFRLDKQSANCVESMAAVIQDEKLRETFMPYPRWKKALCYLILDFKHFRQSLKQWLSKSDQ